MKIFSKFWAWYEKHYTLNVGIATGLFLLQIVHLFWLTTDVVFVGVFGESYGSISLSGVALLIILLIDYTEIPALIGVSLVYINELRKGFKWKSVLYLIFLNSQWLHIFWITDEFVLERFSGVEAATLLPLWLAWIAIGIDYLELPVMVDTIKKFVVVVRKKARQKNG
jgi:hypothetical protein